MFGFLFHDRGEEFVLCNVKNGMEGTWRDNKWTAPAPASHGVCFLNDDNDLDRVDL